MEIINHLRSCSVNRVFIKTRRNTLFLYYFNHKTVESLPHGEVMQYTLRQFNIE